MVNLARLTHPDLRFNVGSITDLDLSDAAVGGVLAWYSTIHTPPQDLPSVFAEFSRVLTPGGYLLVGFHVGDEGPPRMVVFRDGVSVDAYDVTPERVADLCRQAGLVVHAQLLRAVRGSRLLIHPLCECELLFVQPGLDELDWGEPAMCAVGPVHVVVDPPVLEEDLGLEQGVEALAVEVLVA